MTSLMRSTHKIFWMNSSTLGYDALKHTIEAIDKYTTLYPRSSLMLIAAPTVGSFGTDYSESEVLEQGQKILDALKNADNRHLARGIAAVFDASSIPAQSPRQVSQQMELLAHLS